MKTIKMPTKREGNMSHDEFVSFLGLASIESAMRVWSEQELPYAEPELGESFHTEGRRSPSEGHS